MRTSTFLASFLVHALIIGAAAVTRILATGELPEPPHATTFIMASAEMPTVAPPRAAAQQPVVAATAAPIPLAEPDVIAPEVPRPEPFDVPVGDGLVVGLGAGSASGIGDEVLPLPPAPAAPAQPAQPVRVGGDVRAPQKVHHVAPVYPAIARSGGITGLVILEAIIDVTGSVRDVRVLRSVPLLDDAAVAAVRQWRFTPTLLNGQPIPVIMTVTVSFSLN